MQEYQALRQFRQKVPHQLRLIAAQHHPSLQLFVVQEHRDEDLHQLDDFLKRISHIILARYTYRCATISFL